MSETVQQLTSQQAAELRSQLRAHDMHAVDSAGAPFAPLPPCPGPGCGVPAERVVSHAEDVPFGERPLRFRRYRWSPCGHEVRELIGVAGRPVGSEEKTA